MMRTEEIDLDKQEHKDIVQSCYDKRWESWINALHSAGYKTTFFYNLDVLRPSRKESIDYIIHFDPDKTPVRNRGILPQDFLRYPSVKRSNHPISSVAAIGEKAEYFTRDHSLHESEGVVSPCHKLYEKNLKKEDFAEIIVY